MTLNEAFIDHVERLVGQVAHDEDAAKSLAIIALLVGGWSPGPDGGDAVVDLTAYRLKLAA